MGSDADESTPTPPAVRNQITDGTVYGSVVQAGTFNGQIHHHYSNDRRPLDLLALRLWLDRVAEDYRVLVAKTQDPAGAVHLRQVDLVRAGLAPDADTGARGRGGPSENERHRDVIRRLVVAGIVSYLARPGPAPDEPLPEQILLDLIVFSLWPVVTARKLPPDWQGDLAQMTSTRLAALVERERDKRQPVAETFARAVANRSFSPAMVTLFDDLADPQRGGGLLTAMAVAGGLPAPPTGRREGKRVAAWMLAVAGGTALATTLTNPHSGYVRILGEVAGGLPIAPHEPVRPADLAQLVDWLLN
ncbi:hypothetical protein [Micromonospora chokoriensis]|uniref:Uncharacterized protein n=1 Tax=Micromonospora chokoriensis TaxID=356851 RepID=A0A1C4VG24_9ACTN|nr:hypothetical protein [Micromonospora chokoriensis]SCE82957.1 hypothetical protein GA0070612_1400 [Micromonospora chokoriensis]